MPIIKKTIKTEDKIFAHIHNDYVISGSGLEGGDTSDFSTFLIDVTNYLVSEKEKDSVSTEALNSLKTHFESIKASCEEGLTVGKACESILSKLKTNRHVVFASGWSGTDEYSGHSIIAELKYDNENNLLVIIHNNGAGVKYHAHTTDWKGVRSASAKIYKIPHIILESTHDSLQILIQELTKSILDDKQKIVREPYLNADPAQMFYLQLSCVMNNLDAQEVNPKALGISYSLGQRGGTCSWKSLMAFVKNALGDNDDIKYLLVKFEIKLYSLIQYFNGLIENKERLDVEFVNQQLSFACENFARLIQKIEEKGIKPIPINKKKLALKTIEQVRAMLKTQPVKVKQNILLAFTNDLQPMIVKAESIYIIDDTSDRKTLSDMPNMEPPLLNNDDLIQSLRNIHTFALNQDFDVLQMLLVLESFVGKIVLVREVEIANISELSTLVADLSMIHADLCGKQEAGNLRFESKVTSATLNLLLLQASNQILEKIHGSLPPDIKPFIYQLFNEILNLKQEPVIAFNSSLTQRIDEIVVRAEELSNNYSPDSKQYPKFKDIANSLTLNQLTEKLDDTESKNLAKKLLLSLDHCQVVLSTFNAETVIVTSQKAIKRSNVQEINQLKGLYLQTKQNDKTDYVYRAYLPSFNVIQSEMDSKIRSAFGVDDEIQNKLFSEIFMAPGKIELLPATFDTKKIEIKLLDIKHAEYFKLIKYGRSSSDINFLQDMCFFWCADCSIMSVIYEFIKRYPEKLKFYGVQDAIILRMFANGNIERQVMQSSLGLLDLTQLLIEKLKVNSERNDQSSYTFIFKILLHLEGYLSSLSKLDDNADIALKLLRKSNEDIINLVDSEPNNLSFRILQVLYYKNKLEQCVEMNDSDIVEVMKCQLLLNTKTYMISDVAVTTWLEKTMIEELLIANVTKISKLNNDMLSKVFSVLNQKNNLKINITAAKYPLYSFHDDQSKGEFQVNIITGQVFCDGETVCETPSKFLNELVYKDYFKNEKFIGCLNARQNIFTFACNDIKYKLCVSSSVSLMRYFDEVQYKYVFGLHRNQHILFGLIPSTLIDARHDVWMNDDGYIITDRNSKAVLYSISSKCGVINSLDQTLFDTRLEKKSLLLDALRDFESEEYIEIWGQAQGAKNYTIKLPRYDLTFIMEGDTSRLILQNDARYELDLEPNNTLMLGFQNYLVLKPVSSDSGLNKIAITPQQDIIHNFDNGEIKLDICNEVKVRRQIIELNKEFSQRVDRQKDLVDQMKRRKSNLNNFNYNGSEHFTKFEISRDDEFLEPRTCEEILHLTYIYLSTDKFLEALDLLRKSLDKYTGAAMEVKWLCKIIDKQPANIAITKAEKRVYQERVTYENVALKAFAMYILSNNTAVMSGFTDEEKLNLADNCNVNMRRYYNIYNNIPYSMRLDKLEEIVVLQAFPFANSEKRLEQLRSELVGDEIYMQHEEDVANNIDLEQKVELPSINTTDVCCFASDWKSYCRINNKPSKKDSVTNQENLAVSLHIDGTSQDLENFMYNFNEMVRQLISKDKSSNSGTIKLFIMKLIKQLMNPIGNIYIEREIIQTGLAQRFIKIFTFLLMLENYKDSMPDNIRNSIVNVKSDDISDMEDSFENFIEWFENESDHKHNITMQNESIFDFKTMFNFPNEPELTKISLDALPDTELDSIAHDMNTICEYIGLQVTQTSEIEGEKHKQQDVSFSCEEIIKSEFEIDLKVGAKQNADYREKQNSLLAQLKVNEIHNIINSKPFASLEKDKSELSILKNQIVDLANTVPEDESSEAILKLAAREKQVLSFKEILSLFLRRDASAFYSKTFLNEDQINTLQTNVFKYLEKATCIQHLERVLNVVNKLEATQIDEEKESLKKILCSLLVAKREYKMTENWPMLLFEFLDNKLIRHDQVKYLQALTHKENDSHVNMLCQIIMGGGKSKILLPILAQQKANGYALPIVVVSKGLYQTNFADLTICSNQLFGQKLYELSFDRNVDVSDGYFEKLYVKLLAIIRQGGYLLTTPESLQSLVLKYLEIVKFSFKDIKSQEYKYLEKTVALLQERGDVIIDEADLNLQTNKELNYALGDKVSIMLKYPTLISNMVDLFSLLEDMGISDYVDGRKSMCTVKEQDEFIEKLVIRLLKAEFFTSIFNCDMTKNDMDAVKLYLTQKTAMLPEFVNQCSDEAREQVAVFKENLSGLLVQTLSKHRDENYGLRSVVGNQIKSNIAVPYVGANTPTTNSEFASILEQVNYTIQSHIGRPLSKEIFAIIFNSFSERYKLSVDCGSHDVAKQIQDEFNLLFDSKSINLNFSFNDQLSVTDYLYQNCKSSTQIKKYALINHILPGITVTPIQVRCNSQDLIRMFKSVQCFTGTPYNYRTLMPFLSYNSSLSIGADGRTVDNIKRNTRSIKRLTNDDIFSLISTIIEKNVNALIDQGAICKSFSNVEVANNLKDIFNKQKSSIKYILYFNDHDQLTALQIDAPYETKVIGATDPQSIFEALHVNAVNCFTYYDQRHSTGVDIQQAYNAVAFITMSEISLLRDMMQAAMRMRNLSENQQLIFILSEQVDDKINSIEDIINFALNNQIARLADDHYTAAKQKMVAIVAADFRRRLILADMIDKEKYMQEFSSVFFTENTNTLFSEYGSQAQESTAAIELKNFMEHQFRVWSDALKSLGIDFAADSDRMSKSLSEVVIDSVSTCQKIIVAEKRYELQFGQEQVQEQEQEQEQEQQKEQEKKVQKQMMQQNDIRNSSMLQRMIFKPDEFIYEESPSCYIICDLERAFELAKIKIDFEFSSNIFLSQNFIQVCSNDRSFLKLKRECYDVMIYTETTIGTRYILLTPEDSAEVVSFCLKKGKDLNAHVMICSIQGHTHFDSNPEQSFDPKDYDSCMQQIAFYNGDSQYLILNDQWIKENTVSKIAVLTQIVDQHPNKMAQLIALKNKLLVNTSAGIKDKRLSVIFSGNMQNNVNYFSSASSDPRSIPIFKPRD